MVEIWEKRWKNSDVQNISLIDKPKLRVPGFELLRAIWTTLNRARREQGKCNYLMLQMGKDRNPPLRMRRASNDTPHR